MQIAIGSDHRGLPLKDSLVAKLSAQGHDVTDVGPNSTTSVDYPDFASQVACKVGQGDVERGILVCGTGIGMSIAANKFSGVRAAVCADEVYAEMSRRHNDLNVLCLAGDMLSPRSAERIVDVWMTTEFEGGRHDRRIGKIKEMEGSSSSC